MFENNFYVSCCGIERGEPLSSGSSVGEVQVGVPGCFIPFYMS